MMPKDIYKTEWKCRLYQGFSESISLLLIQDHFMKYPGLHLFVLQSKPESRMLLIWRTTSATGGPENSFSIAINCPSSPLWRHLLVCYQEVSISHSPALMASLGSRANSSEILRCCYIWNTEFFSGYSRKEWYLLMNQVKAQYLIKYDCVLPNWLRFSAFVLSGRRVQKHIKHDPCLLKELNLWNFIPKWTQKSRPTVENWVGCCWVDVLVLSERQGATHPVESALPSAASTHANTAVCMNPSAESAFFSTHIHRVHP